MGVTVKATVRHGFSQEEIAEAVRATLTSLWGVGEPDPGIFESNIAASLSGSGERVTVDITEEGKIRIVSETVLPVPLYDGGKNEGNIKRFLDALKRTLAANGLAESKPEAYASFLSEEDTYIGSSPKLGTGPKAVLGGYLGCLIAFALILLAVAVIALAFLVVFVVFIIVLLYGMITY